MFTQLSVIAAHDNGDLKMETIFHLSQNRNDFSLAPIRRQVKALCQHHLGIEVGFRVMLNSMSAEWILADAEHVVSLLNTRKMGLFGAIIQRILQCVFAFCHSYTSAEASM